MTSNKPIDTICDGSLQASIWKNPSERGDFYSVRIARTYTDQAGNYKNSDRFSGAELLRLGHLANSAYDRTQALQQADRKLKVTDQAAA
jgi:hypothetical protein